MSIATDPLALASLLSSRLCHDLINPVGAMGTGLEVMETEDDPVMQAEARKLIKLSADKSIAMLGFARLAFGAGSAYGAEIDLDDGKRVMLPVFDFIKPDLDWQLPGGHVPKDFVKAVLNITLMMADCVPRAGSKVTVSGHVGEVVIRATGPKAKLKPELLAAFAAEEEGLEPKTTPAYLAGLIADATGGKIRGQAVSEEEVVLLATFPAWEVRDAAE
ncbi:histidine phosphotransferase family protein [Aquisalinus flavus]|uniref:Histidine phosphotransferase n=1 Tax=Aquisalinus flavus TaxID=1526572 RepID=A0A8J2V172_9PROT|nr:histidine phosphotransferase family protein [Aquisalinus flavus]MBD0427561.1 histidine phosphotransferase [Aquisalinus flavus]UNE47353.1 histidine phosphotransferase [Aquisalinus flavus]GGD01928.1 histidine phosphotransferase [Aquisalinus flavus]